MKGRDDKPGLDLLPERKRMSYGEDLKKNNMNLAENLKRILGKKYYRSIYMYIFIHIFN